MVSNKLRVSSRIYCPEQITAEQRASEGTCDRRGRPAGFPWQSPQGEGVVRGRDVIMGVRFDVLMTISPLVECRSKANEHMRNTFILTDCYGAPPSRSYIQSLSLFEG